jgi:hypothetical protein
MDDANSYYSDCNGWVGQEFSTCSFAADTFLASCNASQMLGCIIFWEEMMDYCYNDQSANQQLCDDMYGFQVDDCNAELDLCKYECSINPCYPAPSCEP